MVPARPINARDYRGGLDLGAIHHVDPLTLEPLSGLSEDNGRHVLGDVACIHLSRLSCQRTPLQKRLPLRNEEVDEKLLQEVQSHFRSQIAKYGATNLGGAVKRRNYFWLHEAGMVAHSLKLLP